jgi:hypothetical protein
LERKYQPQKCTSPAKRIVESRVLKKQKMEDGMSQKHSTPNIQEKMKGKTSPKKRELSRKNAQKMQDV